MEELAGKESYKASRETHRQEKRISAIFLGNSRLSDGEDAWSPSAIKEAIQGDQFKRLSEEKQQEVMSCLEIALNRAQEAQDKFLGKDPQAESHAQRIQWYRELLGR